MHTHGRRSARWLAAIATMFLTGATTFAYVLVSATPAAAHGSAGRGATNWKSTVHGVVPAAPGVSARTTDLGDHVELTSSGRQVVVVFGYNDEPYLRFDSTGVSVNNRSPAGYINRFATAPGRIPRRFDATAPPEWRRLTRGHTYRWHDHRAHRMAGMPEQAWSVPLSVDGATAAIVGTINNVEPDAPNAALMVGVITLGLGTALVLYRRRAGAIVLAGLVAASAAVQLVGQHRASTESFLDQLGPTLYSIGTIIAAAVLIVVSARGTTRAVAPVTLLCGVAIAVCGGFARFDWLTHSQVPSSLRYEVATSFVVFTMVVGAIFSGIAIRELLQPEAPTESQQD